MEPCRLLCVATAALITLSCAVSPAAATDWYVSPADFNGDGKTNGQDFLIWQSNYRPM